MLLAREALALREEERAWEEKRTEVGEDLGVERERGGAESGGEWERTMASEITCGSKGGMHKGGTMVNTQAGGAG